MKRTFPNHKKFVNFNVRFGPCIPLSLVRRGKQGDTPRDVLFLGKHDDNAAGWGWFVDPTPRDDSEFTTPGDLGE